MSKLPTLSEGAQTATDTARSLLSWLPDPHQCPECNAYCTATQTFDPMMVEYTDSWYCENCNQHFYRERH